MSYLAFGQSNMEGFPGIEAGDKEDDGERDGFPVAASAGFAVGQSITVARVRTSRPPRSLRCRVDAAGRVSP